MTDVNLINAEVLRVAPDEVLIIRVAQDMPYDPENGVDAVADMISAFEQIGLGGRVMIMQLDAEMVVVPRELSAARPRDEA